MEYKKKAVELLAGFTLLEFFGLILLVGMVLGSIFTWGFISSACG